MLSGDWHNDGIQLIFTHLYLDLFLFLTYTIHSIVTEYTISKIDCSPLSTDAYCNNLRTQKSLELISPIAICTTIVIIGYIYLFADSKYNKQHPRTVAISVIIHMHFMLALASVIIARMQFEILILPFIGILQDMYCLNRTSISEAMIEKPATSSFSEEAGCMNSKKKGARFFVCHYCCCCLKETEDKLNEL